MHNKAHSIFITGFTLLASTTASAITIDTGKWEFKSKGGMSPETKTTIECVTNGTYDPIKDMTEDGGCTISDKKESSNSVSWKMNCSEAGMPPMTGEGKFTSKGSTASGKMTMSFGNMAMTYSYEGKKISDRCD